MKFWTVFTLLIFAMQPSQARIVFGHESEGFGQHTALAIHWQVDDNRQINEDLRIQVMELIGANISDISQYQWITDPSSGEVVDCINPYFALEDSLNRIVGTSKTVKLIPVMSCSSITVE